MAFIGPSIAHDKTVLKQAIEITVATTTRNFIFSHMLARHQKTTVHPTTPDFFLFFFLVSMQYLILTNSGTFHPDLFSAQHFQSPSIHHRGQGS